jgi:hypothetical protein
MGHLLQGLGMIDDAISHYEAITRIDAQNFRAYAAIVDAMVGSQHGTDEDVFAAVKKALKSKGSDDEAAPGLWAMLLELQLNRCEWSTWFSDRERLAELLRTNAIYGRCEIPPLLPLHFLLPISLAFGCAKASSAHSQVRLPAPLVRTAVWQQQNTSRQFTYQDETNSSRPGRTGPPKRLKVGLVSGLGFGNDTQTGPLLLAPLGWLGVRRRSWIYACITIGPSSSAQSDTLLKELGCDEVYSAPTDGGSAAVEDLLLSASVDVLVHVGGAEDEEGALLLATRSSILQARYDFSSYSCALNLGSDVSLPEVIVFEWSV